MDSQELSVTVVTTEHFFRGVVRTHGQRLLDSLNDPTTDFFAMDDVEVFRASYNVRAAQLPTAAVWKRHIGMVLITVRRHEAPERQANARRVKQQFPAMLTCLGYDIEGTVHLRGLADPVNALSHDFDNFFPVTEALVTHGGNRKLQLRVPVAMIKRDAVSMFHLTLDTPSEHDVLASIRELVPDQSVGDPQSSAPPA